MECSNCKADNPPGSIVCYNCGSRITVEKISIRPPIVTHGSIDKSYERELKKSSESVIGRYLGYGESSGTVEPYLAVILWGFLSYIPPVGFFVNKERKTGFISLLVLFLLIGALHASIYSDFAEIILYILAIFSVTSCYMFVTTYLSKNKIVTLNMKMRFGIAIVSLAVFTMVTTIPFASLYRIASIQGEYFRPIFEPGDAVLMNYSSSGIERNDIVLIRPTLAKVIAVPGDVFTYTDDRRAYVNGEYAGTFVVRQLTLQKRYIVKENEHIVIVITIEGHHIFQGITKVNDSLIESRAIAIINPPERRRFL